MTNAIYSPNEFPWARHYFEHQPVEPGGPGLPDVPVDPTTSTFAKITLSDLWSLAQNGGAGRDLVLYTHGDVDRDVGVSMWLDGAYKTLLTLDVVRGLCDLAPKEFERRFKVPAAMVELYRRLVAEIQACQLNHVAFRSCNIGNRPDYLREFARLFNVRTVTAPKMRDFFARDGVRQVFDYEMAEMDRQLTPEVLGAFTKASKHNKQKKSDAKYRTFGAGADAVKVLIVPRSYAVFDVEILAHRGGGVERFYRENFRFRRPVAFHDSDFKQGGLGRDGMLNPFAKPVPLFGLSQNGGTDRFLLPGEPGYRAQIEVVTNDHFVGGVPAYEAPPPAAGQPVGTLRDRLRKRVRGLLRRA